MIISNYSSQPVTMKRVTVLKCLKNNKSFRRKKPKINDNHLCLCSSEEGERSKNHSLVFENDAVSN